MREPVFPRRPRSSRHRPDLRRPAPPSGAVAGHREERFVGPIFAPGPEYGGKPLPLPTPDQVRFLLRREPVAALRPAAPLPIAPPAAGDGRSAGTQHPPPPSGGTRVAQGPRLPVGPPAPAATGTLRGEASEPAEKERQGSGEKAGALGGAAVGAAPAGTARAGGPAVNGGTPDGVDPNGTGAAARPAEDREPGAPGASPAGNGAAAIEKPGEDDRQRVGETLHEAPLRVRLEVLAGRPRAGETAHPSVQITASAPCHVAVYQVDAAGQVTPLLPVASAARMPALTSLRLATRPGKVSGRLRVVALASRQPLSARAFYRCLLAFLAEPHDDLEAGPAVASVPTAAAAFTALSGYLARHVGAGAASEPLPERVLWDVGVSPAAVATTGP